MKQNDGDPTIDATSVSYFDTFFLLYSSFFALLFVVQHEADIGIEAVFAITKQQRLWGRSSAIEFSGTVREVLGSCHSLDVTVDGFSALSIQRCIKGSRPPRAKKNIDPSKKAEKKSRLPPPRGRLWGSTETNNGPKRRNADVNTELECPIPNEADVSPFLKEDGSVDVSLCRETTMTAEEIAERKALSTRKMAEVRYNQPVPPPNN